MGTHPQMRAEAEEKKDRAMLAGQLGIEQDIYVAVDETLKCFWVRVVERNTVPMFKIVRTGTTNYPIGTAVPISWVTGEKSDSATLFELRMRGALRTYFRPYLKELGRKPLQLQLT